MYFNFENTTIYYRITGKGKAVVLLHGFLESTGMWDEYAENLSKSFQVILIDLPGHGKSGFFSTSTTIDKMAGLVMELIEHLNILKISIIGHSLGGYVSLAFAELFPDKLENHILLHSSATADSIKAKEKRDSAIKILSKHPSLYIKQTLAGLFRPETSINFKSEFENLVSIALSNNPKGYIEAVKAMKMRPDRTSVLKSGVRTCFIAGCYDPIIDKEISAKQIKLLRNGTGVFLEKAGHMGFIEEKEMTFKQINRFLKPV